MPFACKLTQTDQSVLINLCESKMASVGTKEKLTVAEQEEQTQVYEVYNKLVLGLDYEERSEMYNEQLTPLEGKIRKLMLATLDRLQEIEVAGSVDIMLDNLSSLFITVFASVQESFETTTFPLVYLISFELVENKIVIVAQDEEVQVVDYPNFLEKQLEKELKEELL